MISFNHYSDIIMSIMASQIISPTIVYSIVYSGADQRKHQSSTSLAIVRVIHWWPVNYPHEGSVMWKMFPFDDIIMIFLRLPSDESPRMSLMICQHWYRKWLIAMRHKTIYWTNADQVQWCHNALPGTTDLIFKFCFLYILSLYMLNFSEGIWTNI